MHNATDFEKTKKRSLEQTLFVILCRFCEFEVMKSIKEWKLTFLFWFIFIVHHSSVHYFLFKVFLFHNVAFFQHGCRVTFHKYCTLAAWAQLLVQKLAHPILFHVSSRLYYSNIIVYLYNSSAPNFYRKPFYFCPSFSENYFKNK